AVVVLQVAGEEVADVGDPGARVEAGGGDGFFLPGEAAGVGMGAFGDAGGGEQGQQHLHPRVGVEGETGEGGVDADGQHLLVPVSEVPGGASGAVGQVPPGVGMPEGAVGVVGQGDHPATEVFGDAAGVAEVVLVVAPRGRARLGDREVGGEGADVRAQAVVVAGEGGQEGLGLAADAVGVVRDAVHGAV